MGTIVVSQKRIEANRRNALKSTGPRSAAGKENSRRNGLVHGLAGEGVVVGAREEWALETRIAEWNERLVPSGEIEAGLVRTIAVESLRIERCQVEEELARGFRARRVGDCWEDERKAAIAHQARGLVRRPAETANRLASSAPGCQWLINRWRSLGYALAEAGDWTDDQCTMALDMLGIDEELRAQITPIDAPEGVDSAEFRQALVAEQIARLTARKQGALDEVEGDLRSSVAQGYAVDLDPATSLIRRYESACFRRMKWALDLIEKNRLEQALNPSLDEAVQPDSEPSIPAQASASPAEGLRVEGLARLLDALEGLAPVDFSAPRSAAQSEANEPRTKPVEKLNSKAARKLRRERSRRAAAQSDLLTR